MRAKSGQHGSKQGKHGAQGNDVVVDVPLGTVVYRLLPEDDKRDGDGGGTRMWEQRGVGDVEVGCFVVCIG